MLTNKKQNLNFGIFAPNKVIYFNFDEDRKKKNTNVFQRVLYCHPELHLFTFRSEEIRPNKDQEK